MYKYKNTELDTWLGLESYGAGGIFIWGPQWVLVVLDGALEQQQKLGVLALLAGSSSNKQLLKGRKRKASGGWENRESFASRVGDEAYWPNEVVLMVRQAILPQPVQKN